jgi:sortase A
LEDLPAPAGIRRLQGPENGEIVRRALPLALASLLVLGLIGGLAFYMTGSPSEVEGEQVNRASEPAVEEAPEPTGDSDAEAREAEEREKGEQAREDREAEEREKAQAAKERAAEEQAAAEEAAAEEQYAAEEEVADAAPAAIPPDTSMSLSVPKLGLSGVAVLEGEAGLEAGAMHVAGTGYPWVDGSNTYIAGHRVGFPGSGSDRVFYDLPAMTQGDEIVLQDSLGQTYTYRVSEIFAVTPFDVWVTGPVAGRDMVSLQVCTETPDDWWTIGPRLMESGPDSGRLIVRADRVA